MSSFVAIIGAEKAGTTALQNDLAVRTSIKMWPGEFSGFESPEFESRHSDVLELLHSRSRLIKRPNLLHDPLALGRLKSCFPEAIAVVVLRDPVDRFVSAAVHMMRMGILLPTPLDRIVERVFDLDWNRNHPRASQLLSYGLYSEALEYARYMFGKRLMVLAFPDLLEGKVTDSVLAALDYSREPRSARVATMNSRPDSWGELYCAHVSSRLRFNYSRSRERLWDKESQPARLLSKSIAKICGAFGRFGSDPGRISNDSLLTLQDFYRADRSRLLKGSFHEAIYW